MEFDSVVKRRKSVREFGKKKASWKEVLEAVDSAIQGPLAGNHNGFHFLIVEDKDKISEIASFSEQIWIADSGILVLVLSDDSHLESMYGEKGRVYSRQQAGAVVYGFLLKLADLGLSGCWVGAYDDDAIKEMLGIPKHVQIEAIIPVGYSSGKDGGKPKKKSLESVLFWEKWGWEGRPTGFEEGRENDRP